WISDVCSADHACRTQPGPPDAPCPKAPSPGRGTWRPHCSPSTPSRELTQEGRPHAESPSLDLRPEQSRPQSHRTWVNLPGFKRAFSWNSQVSSSGNIGGVEFVLPNCPSQSIKGVLAAIALR